MIDTKDKKDEMKKEEPAKTREEIKKTDEAVKDVSYKAGQKDAG